MSEKTTESFGFGQNDATIGNRINRFKGEKKGHYRLGFAWWNGFDSPDFDDKYLTPKEDQDPTSLTPRFMLRKRHYRQGVGNILNKGPEYTRLLGEEPKTYVGTVIISWPLDPKTRTVTKDSLLGSLPEVMAWIFATDRYEDLKRMHMSGYPMHSWDIAAECTDPGFQKFAFLPASDCLFRQAMQKQSKSVHFKEIAEHIITQTRLIVPRLDKAFGMDLTLDQLRDKLGLGVTDPVAGVGEKEIDDVLGDLLDD